MWNVLALLLITQSSVDGVVRDAQTARPISHALVRLEGTTRNALTDSLGRFSLNAALPARLRISRLGYATLDIVAEQSPVSVVLTPNVRALEAVTVTAIRGDAGRGSGAPITHSAIEKADIEQRYSGQEMPFLLATTPGVTTYSDGGAFSNYTYYRIRGIDQTRTNITLDGIPLNDAEDQGVFFSNFPDFGNSLQSVQIQRGVGTSSLGVASYAGAINFESIALAKSTRGGEVQISRGAFNSKRLSSEWRSGMWRDRFALYGRLSLQETDGYRANSGNRSEGGFLSAAYFGDRTSVKITALDGVSRNQLAYLASSAATIAQNPRDNPLPANDRDRFRQTVLSASLSRLVGASASTSLALYTVSAGGDYDVTFDPVISNFNLASRVTGATAAYNWQQGGFTLNVGGHASSYYRDHWLYTRPDLTRKEYDNRGQKSDISAFAKAAWELGQLTLFGDVQGRQAHFRYRPDARSGVPGSSVTWSFFNPKIGATVAFTPAVSAYLSYGRNGREPTRNDMFAGFDNLDNTNAAFVGALSRVKPERVDDIELGLRLRRRVLDMTLNAYDMAFTNEITPIGALSYIGLPLRKNVKRSGRQGVEVEAAYRGIAALVVSGSAAWSTNRIAEYRDDATTLTYRDVSPLLTPKFVATHALQFTVARPVSVGLDGRYVSRSYLSNTGDRRFVTPPGYLLDGSITLRAGQADLLIQGRNLLDRTFFPGGYTDGTSSYYYVTARRNMMVTTRVRF